MRHGLLRPPMYGEPGGLQGEITIARAARRTPGTSRRRSASGTWARTRSRNPRTSASTTSTASSACPTCTPSGATRTSSRRSAYSEERTRWIENQPFNKCFVHGKKGEQLENVEEVTIPVLSLLDDKWADYSLDFVRRMGARGAAVVPLPLHARRALRQLSRTRGSWARRRPSIRTRTRSSSSTTSWAGWWPTLEATGQLESTIVFVTSDNGPEMETWPDAAYSPFRSSKGSTWEGGQRVPGIVSWPGMIDADRVSDGLFSLMDWFPTLLHLAGADDEIPSDRYIDGVDQTSFLAGWRRRLQPQVPLLLARLDVLGGAGRRSGSSCSRRPRTTTTTS